MHLAGIAQERLPMTIGTVNHLEAQATQRGSMAVVAVCDHRLVRREMLEIGLDEPFQNDLVEWIEEKNKVVSCGKTPSRCVRNQECHVFVASIGEISIGNVNQRLAKINANDFREIEVLLCEHALLTLATPNVHEVVEGDPSAECFQEQMLQMEIRIRPVVVRIGE